MRGTKAYIIILEHKPVFDDYFRLDVILGKAGSKKADTYDSKISVASRIVKVERQVRMHDDIFI